MRDPDYRTFWDALPHISIMRSRPDLQEAFRHEYREEIVGLLSWLHRLGVLWGATSIHPSPPDGCDLCSAQLDKLQLFIDGATQSGMWANMCPKCFLEEGHSIGWGKGQLYLNIGNGDWRLVAGGDPDAREPSDE
ncbi:hypothetical protein LZ496_05740 [Sphingomonas sp. NSE70-1]|uniref:Uncharacterized protein n=1 Tax=Sphingomonas caseinilyticus TaxID=2908205 RepID=A0ABT0RTD7_9SPHN|nr:hypothetical protein [Sphingomonas caseinilyticus]MCL6698282.1 hypothetical protein [Sphingomonas caseinilyticus]